jgi:S1-C subfamily serine protease
MPIRRSANGKIQLGDVIIAIEGVPIQDGDDLLNALDERLPGDTITLQVASVNGERTVKVKLGELKEP